MATASNPFRRKQDAILGIDVSNHTSRPTSQALSRSSTLKSIGGRSLRTVGSIPAGISSIPHIPEEDNGTDSDEYGDRDGDRDAARFMDIRRESESVYSRGSHGSGEGTYRGTMTMSPASESFDPFDVSRDDEDPDDEEYDSLDDDYSIYAGTGSKAAASQRLKALREANNSKRSSSALGCRSSSQDGTTSLPSKAEKMLGMSAQPMSRAHSSALRPRASKCDKGRVQSKAHRLLGVKPDAISKGTRLHPERENSGSSVMTSRTGSDNDDFRRLLGGERTFSFRKGKADSTSDTSSLSRNSLLESHTSRSSRELLSPDSDTLTWTATNATPPPWIGVHPALRGKKASSDYDGQSPISPHTVLGSGRDTGFSAKMVVADFKDFKDLNISEPKLPSSYPVHAIELDATPPPMAELAAPEPAAPGKSLSGIFAALKTHSAPSSPVLADRPITSRSADAPIIDDDDDSDIHQPLASRKPSRPSAIFDNPNIFEMPADVPLSPTSRSTPKPILNDHRSLLRDSRPPSTPPPGQRPGSESPVAPRSPFPPPSKPLPAPPQRRRDSQTLAILPPVAFDAGRTRQMSEDVPISPRSPDPKHAKLRGEKERAQKESKAQQPALKKKQSDMSLNAQTVPSPLALALAEGRPVTKNAPPPLPSPKEQSEKLAAQSKPRVELSDKDASRAKADKKKENDNSDPTSRPFSWQSTKTARSMTLDDAPPMPPPLALKIPSEEIRRAASNIRSGGVTATPLTATSARSRASRLEKALQSALSREGMERALVGEKIEDLFKEAGADEIFATGLGPRTEGLTEEEDQKDAKEAASRAQGLLKDLGDLQHEVDQLRKLYAVGGPLEGQSPIG